MTRLHLIAGPSIKAVVLLFIMQLKDDVVYEGAYSYKIAARNGYGMLHQTITGFFWLVSH